MADEQEIIGRGSMSRMWLVGDTVRRERAAHSDTIAALLRHLEQRGFPYAPRYLGVDEQGRDVLSRVPGVPVPTLRGDGQLVDVGHVVAAFQRAMADFPVDSGMVWRTPEGWPRHGEVVIHTDIAPWNMLEVAGTISGLVDFDSARPGRAIEDVAYAAWHMTPLHDEPMGDDAAPPPVADRPRRLRVFADACGLAPAARRRLVDEIARVQVTQAARVAAGALDTQASTARHWNAGRFATNIARSLLWLEHHRDRLNEALEG